MLHGLVLQLLSLDRVADAPREVHRLRAHAREADHDRGLRGGGLDVAAHAGGVLPVEDRLGRHRAQAPDKPGELLAAPVDEPFLLLDGRVVAAGVAAAADRQPRREVVVGVDVAGGGVPGLVDRDRALLVLGVGLVDRGAGLDRGHGLDDVGPFELPAPFGGGVGQRHRAHLLDHGRRVAVGDARELVAAALGVELRIVVDLGHVEVEDVLAVLLRGRAEPHVAAHAARTRERRVELGQRDVGRADEEDLLGRGLRSLEPQRHLADPLRNEVHGVEPGVGLVREDAAEERRLVDAVHLHEQLVEGQAAHTAAHEGEIALDGARDAAGPAQRGLGLALAEQALAPGGGLEDHVAGPVQRAHGAVEAQVGDRRGRVLVAGGGAGAGHPADALAAPPDGVDLVDEDDALAAPLLGQPLGLVDQVHDDDDVDADEGGREARAGDGHERALEVRGDGLGQHRLAGAGRAEEQHAALALAAALLELLARLPEVHHAGDLLLGLGLAADVLELDAPVGVPGLVAADLLDVGEHQRPDEDQDVDEEEERQLQQQRRELRAVLRDERADEIERAEQRQRGAEDAHHEVQDDECPEQDHAEDDDALEELAPEPDAPAGDDVLLGHLVVGAVHARPGQEPAHHDIDEAAEGGDRESGEDQRQRQADVQAAIQPDEERRGREQPDDRRGAAQPAPFHGQRNVLLAHGRGEALLFGVRHALAQEGTAVGPSAGIIASSIGRCATRV